MCVEDQESILFWCQTQVVKLGPLHLVAAVGLFVSGVNEIHGRVTVTIV